MARREKAFEPMPAVPRAGKRVITNSAITQQINYGVYGTKDQTLTQPYSQHSVTYACMRAVAKNVAQVPFLMRFGTEENEDVIRDGPWVELFDRPCPALKSRSQLWELTLLHLQAARGECMWVLEGKTDKPIVEGEIPAEVWPLSGELFDEMVDKETRETVAWVYREPGGSVLVYEPHQIVPFKLANPYDLRRGLGPGEAAKVAARQDYKASRYNEKFFDNGAVPGIILVSQKALTPAQRDSIRLAWDNKHAGQEKAFRTAVLEGGLDLKEPTASHTEMDFLEGRKLTWHEVMMIYGVPESELGLTENLNFATAQSADKGFWTKTLVPYMKLIEDTLWSCLFRDLEGDRASAGRFRRGDVRYRIAEAGMSRSNRTARHRSRRYADVRAWNRFKRIDPPTPTPGGNGDVWGEFDLSTIEALRENFDLNTQTGERLQKMGYPINQVNDRLDLGMEKQDGWGDEPLVPGTLMPVDDVLNPPEPVVMTPPGGGPGAGATPDDEEPIDDEDGDRAALRPAVEAFLTRRKATSEQAWLKQLRRLVPLENAFRSKFTRWLRDLRAWQLAALARATAAPRSDFRAPDDRPTEEQLRAVLFNTQEWGKKLIALQHANYMQAATAGVESAVTDLGGNFAFDVVDPRVVDVVSRREKVLLTSTPETIQRRVARTLEDGVRNGETIQQLQERLKADFNQFTNRRALMVARTEVAGVVNAARNEVFTAEGVGKHEWVTARDEVVRDSHAAQDGQVVNIGAPFKNGLRFPGDPNGPPGEIINCRCVVIPV